MPCLMDVSRTDSAGRAHVGSQRQIQTHINQRTHMLNSAVAQSLSWHNLDENPNALMILFDLRGGFRFNLIAKGQSGFLLSVLSRRGWGIRWRDTQ